MSIQGESLPLRLLEDSLPEAKLHQDSNGIWVGPWTLSPADSKRCTHQNPIH